VIRAKIVRRVADDHEVAAAALGVVEQALQPVCGLHHLDVALAAQHAPVAAEDHGVTVEAELVAKRATRHLRGELCDVDRIVNDAHLVVTMRKQRRRRPRHADHARHRRAAGQLAVQRSEQRRDRRVPDMPERGHAGGPCQRAPHEVGGGAVAVDELTRDEVQARRILDRLEALLAFAATEGIAVVGLGNVPTILAGRPPIGREAAESGAEH
jgi:hypothetical protein